MTNTSLKQELLHTYPPVLSLENVRVILRISKRKAAWMMHNGYIKCQINEKKTRNYEIKIEDLFAYIDKVEQSDPSVKIPSGLFSSRPCKEHHNEQSLIAPCIVHQAPPKEFRDWLINEWQDVDELLSMQDVSKLVGYTEKTVQNWGNKKTLKTTYSQHRYFTTSEWVAEYLITEGYKVKNKSPIHTQLLLRYYNRHQTELPVSEQPRVEKNR